MKRPAFVGGLLTSTRRTGMVYLFANADVFHEKGKPMAVIVGPFAANVLRRFMRQLLAVLLVFVFCSCKGPTTSEPTTTVPPTVQKSKTFMQMVQDTLHGFWDWTDMGNINFGDSYTLHFNDPSGDSGDGAWYETNNHGFMVGSQRDFLYRILPNMDTSMARFLYGLNGDTLTLATVGGLGVGIVDTMKIVLRAGEHSLQVIYGTHESMQGGYPYTEWGIISGYRYWKY